MFVRKGMKIRNSITKYSIVFSRMKLVTAISQYFRELSNAQMFGNETPDNICRYDGLATFPALVTAES